MGVAAASAVAYYSIERERRLEAAMGKVVSSESDGTYLFFRTQRISFSTIIILGWTPRPDYLAKRKFVKTNFGYFPVEDGFGARTYNWISMALT